MVLEVAVIVLQRLCSGSGGWGSGRGSDGMMVEVEVQMGWWQQTAEVMRWLRNGSSCMVGRGMNVKPTGQAWQEMGTGVRTVVVVAAVMWCL